LAVGGFLFLWTFNPFSSSVLYMHMTNVLEFHEQFFGNTEALSAAAQMVASIAYGFYCRRLKTATLIHLSIVLGVAGTLAYWGMTGHRSALIISMAVGFTSATAVMIQLDLAARICPPRTAGTVFALLMALSNVGASASTLLGGYWYDAWSERLGRVAAFNVLVGVGALFTAGCWLLMPALKRALGEDDTMTRHYTS
jgi:MFS family permease